MDVFFFCLISLAVFFAIFVSASQRLLGVRFGLIRMVIGAALTFLVFSPLMNALAGPPPWTGSTGAAIAYLALTSVCSMLAGLNLPGPVRGPGADRFVAQGP